jgi:hypothetical protein
MYFLLIQGFCYIVDRYTNVANGAMGVNGAIRSIFGAIFPLFASQIFMSYVWPGELPFWALSAHA